MSNQNPILLVICSHSFLYFHTLPSLLIEFIYSVHLNVLLVFKKPNSFFLTSLSPLASHGYPSRLCAKHKKATHRFVATVRHLYKLESEKCPI